MNNSEMNKLWSNVESLVSGQLNPNSKETFNHFLKGGELVEIRNNDLFIVLNQDFSLSYANHLINYYNSAVLNVFQAPYKINFITQENYNSIQQSRKKDKAILKGPRSLEHQSYEDTLLNKELTFKRYVVDNFNKTVVGGLKNIVSFESYPNASVFIHGKTGRGKTHLLHAIGNHVYENSPHKKVIYITAEYFGKLVQEGFKKKISPVNYVVEELGDYDLVLVDDIQSVASWAKTIETFFHLYNYLVSRKKLVIVVSDQEPVNMKYLEDRMISRFTGGLVLELLEASHESTIKIIDIILEQNNAENLLTENAKKWISREYQGDIRTLKGVIIRLIYLSNFNDQNEGLDEQACGAMLGKKVTKTGQKLDTALIKDVVAKTFNISVDMLESSSRNKSINVPRQLCMYLMKEKFNTPLSKIGSEFGGKDHSTVINAIKKTELRINTDMAFKQAVEKVRELL